MRSYEQCIYTLEGLIGRPHPERSSFVPLVKGLLFQPHYWNVNYHRRKGQIKLEIKIIDLLKSILPLTVKLEWFVWEAWDRPCDDDIWAVLRKR
jgi:hypothetical protein